MPRQDGESTYSLQGSVHAQRESPRPSQRKLDRAPLYLPDDSRAPVEQPDMEQLEFIRKPLAMVRPSPRQILSSIVSSGDEYSRFDGLDLDCHNLRESRSLDPFPTQLRRRTDIVKMPSIIGKRSSRSLDGGRVAMISNNPNCGGNDNPSKKNSYKHLNNNCNGSIGIDDAHCPLIVRQGSLNSPHDDSLLQQTKRWRSLETVAVDDDLQSKKSLNRGSIKSWLVGIFQGNGLRSSNASLRKVGVMQSGVRGLTGFGELPTAPEHESIV